jgi:signal transduction histidine kinase
MLPSLIHELQGDLVAIRDTALIVSRLDDLKEIKHATRRLDASANGLMNTLDRFISISRTRRSVPDRNLYEIIDDAVFGLSHEAKRNGCVIETKFSQNKLRTLVPSDMREAILCLLHNAIESGTERVKVEVFESDNSVKLEIADYGSGVDEAFANRIFEFGFTTKVSRFGMGLTLAKDLVKKADGAIRLERHCNPTVFSIVFNRIEGGGSNETS